MEVNQGVAMNHFEVPLLSAALAGIVLAGSPAQAASIAPTATNWALSAQAPQFDPALGNLQDIGFTLTGTLTGAIGVESIEILPSTVAAGISSTINLFAPGGGPVLSVAPAVSAGPSLSGFDGKIDFGGASGRTFAGLSATQTAQTTYTIGMPGPQIPTAPFVGTGTVALPVTATANASLAGPLNLAARTQAAAGAEVSVQYGTAGSAPSSGGPSAVTITMNHPPIPPFQLFGVEHTPVQTVLLADQPGNWTQDLTVGRFDPALGTLVSADLGLQGHVTAGLSLQNTGVGAAAYDVNRSVTFDLQRPGGTSLLQALAGFERSGSLDSSAAVDDFSGPFGTTFTDDFLSPLAEFSADSLSDLALFTGSGSLTLQLEAIGLLLADVPGSADLLSSAIEGAQLTLSYSYLPAAGVAATAAAVPEPSGAGLLILSLLGLAAAVQAAPRRCFRHR
jgi:hypothetical protein